MLRMHSLLPDESMTTPGRWVRPFDIFDISTSDGSGAANYPLIQAPPPGGTVAVNQIPITRVIAMCVWGDGWPRYFWEPTKDQLTIQLADDLVFYGSLAAATPLEDHQLSPDATLDDVEEPVEALQWIKDATSLSDGDIGTLLGVSRTALDDWRKGRNISTPRLRRLYAVRDVLARAAARLPSQEHFRAWLVTPRGADGQTPEDLLRADEIDRVRLLAMSLPSAHLVQAPAWVRQSTLDEGDLGFEARQKPEPLEDEQDIPAVPRRKGARRTFVRRRVDEQP